MLLVEALHAPGTLFAIAVCLGVKIWMDHRRIDPSEISISYEAVVTRKEYWRVVSGSLAHASWFHLLFNMVSLWDLRHLELLLGTAFYIRQSVLLMILSISLYLLLQDRLIRRLQLEHLRNTQAVGYSCVNFGLLMTSARMFGTSRRATVFFGFHVSPTLAPFASLMLTQSLIPSASLYYREQLIVPRSSLLGHFCGILAGLFLSWSPLMTLSAVSTITLLSWLAVGLVYSLYTTAPQRIPNWLLTIEKEQECRLTSVRVEPDDV